MAQQGQRDFAVGSYVEMPLGWVLAACDFPSGREREMPAMISAASYLWSVVNRASVAIVAPRMFSKIASAEAEYPYFLMTRGLDDRTQLRMGARRVARGTWTINSADPYAIDYLTSLDDFAMYLFSMDPLPVLYLCFGGAAPNIARRDDLPSARTFALAKNVLASSWFARVQAYRFGLATAALLYTDTDAWAPKWATVAAAAAVARVPMWFSIDSTLAAAYFVQIAMDQYEKRGPALTGFDPTLRGICDEARLLYAQRIGEVATQAQWLGAPVSNVEFLFPWAAFEVGAFIPRFDPISDAALEIGPQLRMAAPYLTNLVPDLTHRRPDWCLPNTEVHLLVAAMLSTLAINFTTVETYALTMRLLDDDDEDRAFDAEFFASYPGLREKYVIFPTPVAPDLLRFLVEWAGPAVVIDGNGIGKPFGDTLAERADKFSIVMPMDPTAAAAQPGVQYYAYRSGSDRPILLPRNPLQTTGMYVFAARAFTLARLVRALPLMPTTDLHPPDMPFEYIPRSMGQGTDGDVGIDFAQALESVLLYGTDMDGVVVQQLQLNPEWVSYPLRAPPGSAMRIIFASEQ